MTGGSTSVPHLNDLGERFSRFAGTNREGGSVVNLTGETFKNHASWVAFCLWPAWSMIRSQKNLGWKS